MKKTFLLLSAVVISSVSAAAYAEHHMEGHDHGAMMKHEMMKQDKAAETASTKAYIKANEEMHKGMDIKYTGDADVDFLKGMIPHHEGAVAMAKVVLEHGKDPEIKKLAEGIIKAQEAEISQMKEWLKAKEKAK